MRLYTSISVALLLLLASCGGSNEATESKETSQAGLPAQGKELFVNNCAQCHRVMQDMNGPKLVGSLQRWNNDTAKLVRYIKNSQDLIKTDPYAAKLFKDWSNMIMPPFPNLSEGEIKSIIKYINEPAN